MKLSRLKLDIWRDGLRKSLCARSDLFEIKWLFTSEPVARDPIPPPTEELPTGPRQATRERENLIIAGRHVEKDLGIGNNRCELL